LGPAREALVRDALTRPSEFYRKRLQDAGIDSKDVGIHAWLRLPPTRRAELVDDQLAHPPLGSRALDPNVFAVRAGTTGSGTDLLVLAWTTADLARERAAGVRSLHALGVRPGMRVANTLPGALFTPGSLLLGDVVDELGALDMPLGEITDNRSASSAWKLMQRVQPQVLILRPCDADILFAEAPGDGLSSLQSILWLQTESAWQQPLIASRFTGTHGVWLAIPEATSFAAVRCRNGLFHSDSAVIVESSDADGAAVAHTAPGTLLITTIGDSPLLRYATGMPAAFAACACDWPTPAFRLG